jgi:hypothetical protein
VIRDLLWGCVICGEMESLHMVDRIEMCAKCGAKYRRAHGAEIAVEVQGRGVETRSAAEWTSQLPPVTPTGTAECLVRIAESDTPVRGYGEYLGRVEKFGNFRFGQLTISETSLQFEPRDDDDGFEWPLSDITAVQPSSTALQVKARKRPVVSIKFANSSSRLWEERLQLALRHHYSNRDIIEFQPRICLR